MKKMIMLVAVLSLAVGVIAGEIGEKQVKTAMTLSSLLPGAGQFYLGNTGKGFTAMGGELLWWGGAAGFFLAGRMSGSEARQDTTARGDSLQTLSTAMYVGSGVFAALALGWRALMVSQVHDDAVARNYRHRFLHVRAGPTSGPGGVRLGLHCRI